MTPKGSLTIALLALTVLIGVWPRAEAQFPHGLLAGTRDKPEGGGICTIETRPLSFGAYDTESNAPLDALAQVIYACNNQASKIRIEMTTGAAGQFDRRMSAGTGTDFLRYNIYLDATHTTIWGQGAFGTDVYYEGNPPNGTPVVVPAYGRIPPRQDVEPGEYRDVLTVRILF